MIDFLTAAAATNDAALALPAAPPGIRRLVQASIAWFDNHWLEILIAAAVAAGIVALLYVVRNVGIRLCRKAGNITGWGDVIGRTIARTGDFFIIITAVRLVAGFAYAPPSVMSVVGFLFTVAAVFQAAVWARELILGFVEMRTNSETYHGEALATALGLIRVLVTIALFAIALIVVLDNLGVDVTGLVAGLGIGGIAIGLAAQGIFADLFAALSIIFDKPFRRGDSIAYDTTNGSIESIGLKSTRIRAFTGEELVISNRNLLDKEITNNTQRLHRRGKFAIGVIYQTPPKVAAQIPAILEELTRTQQLLFVRAGFIGFGASSLDFEFEFDSPGPDYAQFYERRTALGLAILERFNAEGIEIAYPTQTTFTADPDGKMILPYPQVQPVIEMRDPRGASEA